MLFKVTRRPIIIGYFRNLALWALAQGKKRKICNMINLSILDQVTYLYLHIIF